MIVPSKTDPPQHVIIYYQLILQHFYIGILPHNSIKNDKNKKKNDLNNSGISPECPAEKLLIINNQYLRFINSDNYL